jgi:hypothetical protein
VIPETTNLDEHIIARVTRGTMRAEFRASEFGEGDGQAGSNR